MRRLINFALVGVVTTSFLLVGSMQAQASTPAQISPPARYPLVLKWEDNGRTFAVPVGTIIDPQFVYYPYANISYDPRILQLLWVDSIPYPLPNPEPYPPQSDGFKYPLSNWQLMAVQPGTTMLSLVPQPCPADAPCTKLRVRAFRVTIIVTNVLPPSPEPPYPSPIPPQPPILPGADVYISTAYLDQTVRVRTGQIVSVDLPFLASRESVRLAYDSAILQPLSGQNLTSPQIGGWRFRVLRDGSTAFTVSSTRCLDVGGNCGSSLVFRVTIASGG